MDLERIDTEQQLIRKKLRWKQEINSLSDELDKLDLQLSRFDEAYEKQQERIHHLQHKYDALGSRKKVQEERLIEMESEIVQIHNNDESASIESMKANLIEQMKKLQEEKGLIIHQKGKLIETSVSVEEELEAIEETFSSIRRGVEIEREQQSEDDIQQAVSKKKRDQTLVLPH